MNDTVTKLMELADRYAWSNASGPFGARQALQDELTRLFTPLSDEQKDAVWIGSGPLPPDSFCAGVEWAERQHGITGESNEPT